jgi:hypothetical protein
MEAGGTEGWKSGTQSTAAARCLRIGLEPTGSASGHTVSITPVPAATAEVTYLGNVVGQATQICDSPAVGRCRRSARPTNEPEPNGDQHHTSGLLHFALLLDIPKSLLPKRQDACSVLCHQGRSVERSEAALGRMYIQFVQSTAPAASQAKEQPRCTSSNTCRPCPRPFLTCESSRRALAQHSRPAR